KKMVGMGYMNSRGIGRLFKPEGIARYPLFPYCPGKSGGRARMVIKRIIGNLHTFGLIHLPIPDKAFRGSSPERPGLSGGGAFRAHGIHTPVITSISPEVLK